jgi:predicted nucleic acid-binding protein
MLLIADTSVLVNFLRVDRMVLIGRHEPQCVITQHVVDEVTELYPEQRARLQAALDDGHLAVIQVSEDPEIDIFGRLQRTGRLGVGESSAIAVAFHRGYPIAIDDRPAIRRAEAAAVEEGIALTVLKTPDIIVRLIKAGHLSVEQADVLLVSWRTQHRFHLKIDSFADLLY